MSLHCNQNHMVRKNEKKLEIYTCNMPYVSFFEIFMGQFRERKQRCNFWKLSFDCRRFKILCYDWDGIVVNSNQKHGIYCTVVRFCQRNVKYPKRQCMTIDCLNSGPVDEDFINFVEKNEIILFETANELRRASVW